MVDLVALAQAAQDADRVLDRRLADEHGLEAPLERGVLFDVLAVFVERGRANRVQLAARQHRLEQVRGVDRAFGGAGADDGVQLVDEQHDLALGVAHFLEHGLQPLLELAAVLRAGDERAHVERDDALVAQAFGHVAADDALREPFDDGGLADAGLADQHRVVLRAAREHLNHAADLVVAADDRIELALARDGGQVAAVALERLVLALGILIGHALRAAHAGERLEDRVLRDAERLQRLGGRRAARLAAIARNRCSVLVNSSFSRAASSSAAVNTARSARREPGLGRPGPCGSASMQRLQRGAGLRRDRRHLAEHGRDDAVGLLDQGERAGVRAAPRRAARARRAAARPGPLPGPSPCTCSGSSGLFLRASRSAS